MKLSELVELTESIRGAVSDVVSKVEAKFSARVDGLMSSISRLEMLASKSADAAEVSSIRAALIMQAEDFRTELEARLGDKTEPLRVKSVSTEGKSLTVELTDGTALEIPAPEDGKDGSPGAPGRDGADGKDGAPGEAGKDGRDGVDGKDGSAGVGVKNVYGESGFVVIETTAGDDYKIELPAPAAPADPRDPIDIRDALIDRNGDLNIVFSDGTTKNVGRIVGRDGIDGAPGRDGLNGAEGLRGEPGRDGLDGINGIDGINGVDGRNGVDGFGFDDMSAELQDDGRTVVFRFSQGERVKEFPMKFPVSIFRGGYNPETVYDVGDVVSYGGNTYHANAETIGQVPGVSDTWRQMTAAGRSIRGERGIPGKDGRNGVDGKDLRAFT